ncbi:MAG: prenyltransferase/squalene oxidase repeat-containing protein [Planctomycetota bacterium]
MFRRPKALFALLLIFAFAASAFAARPEPSGDPRQDARALLERGLDYLAREQSPDGSWRSHVGISGLALASFLRNPVGSGEQHRPVVEKGLVWLVSRARADGGIHDGDYPAYSTAIACLALHASGRKEYAPLIDRARAFLAGMQLDESDGIAPSNPSYGGMSYDGKKRPDLSNTHFVLQALRETGSPANDPLFEKAVTFLERLQNRKESNDQPWAGDDGGFVYAPDESKAGEDVSPAGEKSLRSYASMTYAGLLSYLYAGLTPDDPRVRAACDWIRAHYSLDENPGLGLQGLYYNYHTLAKTFAILGKPVFTDAAGNPHEWKRELVGALASRERPDGSWVNPNSRWFENDPLLVTSYACLALSWTLAP